MNFLHFFLLAILCFFPLEKGKASHGTLEEEKKLRGNFSFLFTGTYDSLHGLGRSTSVLVSRFQPKWGLGWQLFWNERWYFSTSLQLIFKDYEKNTLGHEILSNRKFRQGEVHMGLGYRWNKHSFGHLALGFCESIYYRQIRENIYYLEIGQRSSVKLKFSQRILGGNFLSLALLGQWNYLGEKKDLIKQGVSYGGGLELKYFMKSSALGGEILYREGDFISRWFPFEYRVLDFIFSYQTEF